MKPVVTLEEQQSLKAQVSGLSVKETDIGIRNHSDINMLIETLRFSLKFL